MIKMKILLVIIILISFLTFTYSEDKAVNIMKIAENNLFPNSFYMKFKLIKSKPGKEDTSMEMEGYYKANAGSLITILSPARSKGITFLQKDENLWMYDPKSNSRRAIRLSSKDSFQGSTFSNNDISDTKYSDDYNLKIAGEEEIEAFDLGRKKCLILEGEAVSPKTTYAKIKMWVTEDKYMPVKLEYYTKSGLLFKEMILSGFKNIAGKLRPTVFTVKSVEKKGVESSINIEKIQIKNDLSDNMFTQSYLLK